MKSNKLVTNKVPKVIKTKNINSKSNKEENWLKLKEKLDDGVKQFSNSEGEEEIATILSVINEICDHKNFDMNKLEQLRKKKENPSEDKVVMEED